MSYLIGMYVFYHGNNLKVFGIYPGMARDESLNNRGLRRPDELNPELINPEVISQYQTQVEKEKMFHKMNDWDQMMMQAMKEAESKEYALHQAGLIQNSVYDHSENVIVDDYYDDGVGNASIPMKFFNEINGIK